MNKSLAFYHKMTIEELLKVEDPILKGELGGMIF